MKSVKTIEAPYVEGIGNLSRTGLEDVMLHKSAKAAVDSVNWPEEYPYAPECSVRIARGDNHLAVMFDVTGKDIRAVEMDDNGRSWEDSCCEIFLSADGKTYFNIEVTCIGSVLIGKGEGRQGRVQLPVDDVATVRRWSSLERKSYDISGGEHHWTVMVLIPFTVMGLDSAHLPDELFGNFYKCGDLTAHPHFVSWNPIDTPSPDFHRPEFFGKISLGK